MGCGCKDRKTPGDQRRDDHQAMTKLRELRVRWYWDGEALRQTGAGSSVGHVDPAEAILRATP